jgi:hypothetical protein
MTKPILPVGTAICVTSSQVCGGEVPHGTKGHIIPTDPERMPCLPGWYWIQFDDPVPWPWGDMALRDDEFEPMDELTPAQTSGA